MLRDRRLTKRFFFEDRCALPNQMCLVLTFPWRGFVLAVRDRDRTNKNGISISVFGVTAKDFSMVVDHRTLTQLNQSKLSAVPLAAQEVDRNFSDTPRFVVSKPHLM
jgi:hypothetical protein